MKILAILILTSGLSVAVSAADAELGYLPDGRAYLKHELNFGLKEATARNLSPAGPGRKPVAQHRLVGLHPSIREVKGGHTASDSWLEGRPLPRRLEGKGAAVPRSARSLKAHLRADTDAADVVETLARHPDVAWASLNFVHPLNYTPNDPNWANQWGPQRVRADDGWDVPPVTTSMRIAIIDTGVDLTHPDLAPRIVYHRGFGGNRTGDAMRDRRGGTSIDHGTHVAGIAAAIRDNSIGVAGMAQADLMAMGCAAWNEKTSQYGVCCSAEAIFDAVDNGADVINCSFGNKDLDSGTKIALDYAKDEGVIVVVAAGNDGTNVDNSDSQGWNDHDWPLIVSNVDSNDTLSASSNYGVAINLAAPGVNILSTYTTNFMTASPNGQYGNMGGTSMASPHVAGGAATVRGTNPNLVGAISAKDVLYRMALDLGPAGDDNTYGRGVLQMDPVYLRILREARAFLNPQTALPELFQSGGYVSPYASISIALSKLPAGSALVLNGDIHPPGTIHSYPPITINTACKLMAFPDQLVRIGE